MKSNKTAKSYLIGFSFSILLTLAAFFLVQTHINAEHSLISHEVLISAILVLAVIQLMIQLFFFLHLGSESGPRFKLGTLGFALGLVLIIVIASLWIMSHLNYNMMASPSQMEQYMHDQQGGF